MERKIPRLLFMLASVKDSERDGRLNDWLRSLYSEVSGASCASPADLVAQLDARLREMAARAERLWVKLGRIIFPGKVTSRFEGGGGGQFVVTANVRGGEVRRALLGQGQAFESRADRLTWADQSFSTQVESVSLESEFTAEGSIEVRCRTPQNFYGDSGSTWAMLGAVGAVGQGEMAEIWARRAMLGEEYRRRDKGSYDLVDSATAPETITLPELLSMTGASGWLAEGLTRLYAVEEVSRRYNGHFQHLEVGPATASGVGLNGAFTTGSGIGSGADVVRVKGVVPLAG